MDFWTWGGQGGDDNGSFFLVGSLSQFVPLGHSPPQVGCRWQGPLAELNTTEQLSLSILLTDRSDFQELLLSEKNQSTESIYNMLLLV